MADETLSRGAAVDPQTQIDRLRDVNALLLAVMDSDNDGCGGEGHCARLARMASEKLRDLIESIDVPATRWSQDTKGHE